MDSEGTFGYLARCGQIVDISRVKAPVQRNKREGAEIVKASAMPLSWKHTWCAKRHRCEMDQKTW
jgi:hypothetical protein